MYVYMHVSSVISDSLRSHKWYSLQGSSEMGFSWQEYWSGLSFPPPEDLPDPGIIKPALPVSPALQSLNH